MDFKKILKAIAFPHIAFLIILTPVSVAFLVCSMLYFDEQSVTAIISYVISFYTLLTWCLKAPGLFRRVRDFKNRNKYARRWQDDTGLRVKVSLYGTLIWNTAYAVFQLCLGFYHHTFWYYSFAGYYILLAIMRFFLARYTAKNKAGENMQKELVRYRACGIIFLVMNLALSLIVFFMVYWNRSFVHHEITTITMATYTFAAFTMSVINMVKYKKYNSPVYSAAKTISLACACVSVLTLESTMLTTFGEGTDPLTRKLLLGISGGVISAFIVSVAIYMIIHSTKKLKEYKLGK